MTPSKHLPPAHGKNKTGTPAKRPPSAKKIRAAEIYRILSLHIDPKPELHFSNAFELLVAVVLSAQCTDKNVNRVTEQLWQSVKTPEDYLKMGEEALGQAIHSIGLYRAKAKHLIGLCRALLDHYQGKIPDTREELMTLPGVGRKTANVVLNCWFRQPCLPVDTHIFRVAHRLKFSAGKTPDQVEEDLMKLTPANYLPDAHHYLLLHGRYTCTARSPHCTVCPIQALCPSRSACKPL